MNKRKNNMKKNRIKKFIILVIILAIALVTLAILMQKNKISKEITDSVPDMSKTIEYTRQYLQDKVIPQHIYDFSVEYKGNVDRNILYEKLYTISKFLPDLCSDLKSKKAEDYFSEYSDQVKKYLGIETKDEFLRLAKYLENNDISDATFQYCAYHSGSLVQNTKYSQFQIDFKYEDKEAITFNMEISNTTKNSILVKLVIN